MVINIILPTRNEENNISTLIKSIRNIMSTYQYYIPYKITIIDDSSDKTADIASKESTLVLSGRRLGLGHAILDGINYVKRVRINHSKEDIILVMDSDLQHNPEDIPKLLDPLIQENYDMAIGSRFIKGGSSSGLSFKRQIISKSAGLLAYPISKLKDSTSGFFAFKRVIINEIDLEATSWKIMLEVLIKANPKKVLEVPINFNKRIHGKSNLSKTQIISYIKHLILLYKFTMFKKEDIKIKPSYDWDAIFHSHNPIQKYWKKTLMRKVCKLANKSPFKKVLDCGCGSSPIICNFPTAIGIDINEDKLNFMKTVLPFSNELLYMDIHKLEFEDETFDLVLFIEVIEHLQNPDKAMSEISRVLKTDGRIIIATPDDSKILWKIIQFIYDKIMTKGYKDEHIELMTKKSLIKLAKKHNLKVRKLEYVAYCDMVMELYKGE